MHSQQPLNLGRSKKQILPKISFEQSLLSCPHIYKFTIEGFLGVTAEKVSEQRTKGLLTSRAFPAFHLWGTPWSKKIAAHLLVPIWT